MEISALKLRQNSRTALAPGGVQTRPNTRSTEVLRIIALPESTSSRDPHLQLRRLYTSLLELNTPDNKILTV